MMRPVSYYALFFSAFFMHSIMRRQMNESREPVFPEVTEDTTVEFDFEILATNDLHSSFEGSGPDSSFTAAKDGDPTTGHYARLCQMIKDRRREAASRGEPTLTLDAGDWFGGTLFHIVGPSNKSSHVPELEFFDACDFDATTLGNHDFEPGLDGFVKMIEKAEKLGIRTPIIASNIELETFPRELASAGLFGDGDIDLDNGKSRQVLRRIAVKTLTNGAGAKLRVGLIGLHGPDASLCNLWQRKPLRFVGFEDETKSAQFDHLTELVAKQVKSLRTEHKADVVVVLGHMGHPEDVELAEEVEGIDVIIAAHTHETYLENVHGTILVQSHHQGQYLRALRLRASKSAADTEWKTVLRGAPEESLLHVNDAAGADDEVMDLLQSLKGEVNKVIDGYAWGSNRSYSHHLYVAPQDSALFGIDWKDVNVARVLGDCMIGALAEGPRRRNPPDIFLALSGMVRGIPKAVDGRFRMQLSDIFKLFQSGYDLPSMSPGVPLCTFHMTKRDLWNLLEIGEYVRRFWQEDFVLVPSSRMKISFNKYGIAFVNHMTATFDGKEYSHWPDLIHVATVCPFSQAMYASTEVTKGFFSLLPRLENGDVVKTEGELRELSKDLPNPYSLLIDYLHTHHTNIATLSHSSLTHN